MRPMDSGRLPGQRRCNLKEGGCPGKEIKCSHKEAVWTEGLWFWMHCLALLGAQPCDSAEKNSPPDQSRWEEWLSRKCQAGWEQ